MANAKKCDRCGKYYQVTRKREINSGVFVADIATKISYAYHDGTEPVDFDVCFDCFDSFMDWLNEYHNKGEYNNE